MDERTQSAVIKVIGPAAAFVAAWIAQRLLGQAWRKASGHDMPSGKNDDDGLGELLLAAAVTGAVIALVRTLATRGSTRAAQRFLAERG